jgi:hypothetical protein
MKGRRWVKTFALAKTVNKSDAVYKVLFKIKIQRHNYNFRKNPRWYKFLYAMHKYNYTIIED